MDGLAAFWKSALSVAGLGAIASFVLWSLYKQWLKLPIFQLLTKRQQFYLFILFLMLTFLFALSSLGAYVYIKTNETSVVSSKLPSDIRALTDSLLTISPSEARDRIDKILPYARNLSSREEKNTIIKKLLAVINFNNTDWATRSLRMKAVEAISQISDVDMAALFKNNQLEYLDLYGIDLKNSNLRNVSFKGAILITANFSGATLDGANFTGAVIRNANFANASIRNTIFTDSDWFNSHGLSMEQLKYSNRGTLMPCPKNKEEAIAFCNNHYKYPFDSWDDSLQRQLLEDWKEYMASGGVCETVSVFSNKGK